MRLLCRFLGHDVSWRIDAGSRILLPFCRRCKLAIVCSRGSRAPEERAQELLDGESNPDKFEGSEEEASGDLISPYYPGVLSYDTGTIQTAGVLERLLLLVFVALSASALLSAYRISLTAVWTGIDEALRRAANSP